MFSDEPKAFKIGDHVRILHSRNLAGPVVALRGPLGPKGIQVYTVRFTPNPKGSLIEVREDQMELIERDGQPVGTVPAASESA